MGTGTDFAKMVRKTLAIGPNTRQRREGLSMKDEILDAINASVCYPGYYNEEKSALFSAAWPAYLSYQKHVKGYRVDGMVAFHIEKMTPWQFAGFLGEMIDAGISNVFEGEMFFNGLRETVRAAA